MTRHECAHPPRRRKDGICLTPGCTNKIPDRPKHAYATVQQFETEPFCSAPCAKQFHGVSEPQGRPLCTFGA